jgi:hypothetical protein
LGKKILKTNNKQLKIYLEYNMENQEIFLVINLIVISTYTIANFFILSETNRKLEEIKEILKKDKENKKNILKG